MVYRFDYEKNKPVVTVPLHCMVGCVTCPQHAISFPPLSYVHRLIKDVPWSNRPRMRYCGH